MAPKKGSEGQISAVLDEIKMQNKGQISEHHKALLKWVRNVDRGYAWVVLAALFFMMSATLGPYRIYGLIFARVTSEGIYTREEASWPVSMIFTVENLVGPFVSVIAYHISYRKSLFIGGLILTLGNGFTTLSSTLWLDTLLLGVVQGIGYAFIFMPFMEIINSYFLRYRNSALGFALCGGTLSIFALSPLFQAILDAYPWRYAYFGIALVCSINLIMVPLLKPNPMPRLDGGVKKVPLSHRNTLSRVSVKALSYQNSVRRQSTILIKRQAVGPIQRQASVISVNPFASSAGLERKISRVLSSNQLHNNDQASNTNTLSSNKKISLTIQPQFLDSKQADGTEALSLSEVGQDSDFDLSIIWEVLKTPGFHLIWYSELIYFWVFSIWCLTMVDYGTDRGCTVDEAESLLSFQSIGELTGRLFLTVLVDMRFLSNKNVVILVLLILSGLLTLVTFVQGYIWFATITVISSATLSLLYILLNGLLVDYLGERRVTIGYGMASCIGGVLMSFRPQAVGYFRDTRGTYDPLMICLATSCAAGALLWILEPLMTKMVGKYTGASKQDVTRNQACVA